MQTYTQKQILQVTIFKIKLTLESVMELCKVRELASNLGFAFSFLQLQLIIKSYNHEFLQLCNKMLSINYL